MRTFILLIGAVLATVAFLVLAGFLDLSPEGAEAIEDARQTVGEATQETGRAIEGAGDNVDGQ